MGASKNNIQVGDKYGYWLVLSYAGQDANGKRMWLCLCTSCGKVTSVIRASKLAKGRSQSCRTCCHVMHGLARTPEYRACQHAMLRCTDPDHAQWDDYGGRGIPIQENWRGIAGVVRMTQWVLAHIGPCPPGQQIDRKDNSLGYQEGNLRWATPSENCRNRRSNRPITWNGQTKLLCEWSEALGIPRDTLAKRINTFTSLDDAMTRPLGNDGPKLKLAKAA